MNERTALEIASRLEALIPIAGGLAVEALRRQHAEIERLVAINSALIEKGNSYVIENARQAEEIERLKTVPMKYRRMAFNAQLQEEIKQLTAERDAAIANASALTHHLAQVIGDHNAPSDCYSSGPIFGDPRDAICPACAALHFLSNPRASVDSGRDAAISAAVAAEREACAAVCDDLEATFPGTKTGNTLQWAAEKIRARSSK